MLQLVHSEQNGRVNTALDINDEADPLKLDNEQRQEKLRSLSALPAAERHAEMTKLREQGLLSTNRVRIGTTADRASALALRDAQGRPRLMLMVSADGNPTIQMPSDKGEAARTISLDAAPWWCEAVLARAVAASLEQSRYTTSGWRLRFPDVYGEQGKPIQARLCMQGQ